LWLKLAIGYVVQFVTRYGVAGVPPFIGYAVYRRRKFPGTTDIALPDIRWPLRLRNQTSDREVFGQIFLEQTYDWRRFYPYGTWLDATYNRLLSEGRTPFILDAGANIGFSSIWFATRYPRALIYAVEPDEGNFLALRVNTQKYGTIVPVRAAILDNNMPVKISNSHAPSWMRQVTDATPDSPDQIPGYSVAEVMRMANASHILIAKIDIEGSERALFRSNTEWMDNTTLIAIELHDALAPGDGVSQPFLRAVSQRSFDVMWHGETMFCFSRPSVVHDSAPS